MLVLDNVTASLRVSPQLSSSSSSSIRERPLTFGLYLFYSAVLTLLLSGQLGQPHHQQPHRGQQPQAQTTGRKSVGINNGLVQSNNICFVP